jgi:hypothetical protein
MSGFIPADVTLQVEGTGETLNSANGETVGTWTFEPQTAIVGTRSGAYAAPVGLQVRWLTALYVSGHRVTGRTFFVPFGSDQFGADGQITAAAQTGIQVFVDAFTVAAGSNFVVWHRPRKARAAGPGGKPKALTETMGQQASVTGGQTLRKAAILSSRRD